MAETDKRILASNSIYKTYIEDKWYTEQWEDYGMKFKIEDVVHEEKTPFQHITILKSKKFGHILILDGVTQCAEGDEFVYQEMIAHTPLSCHPNPEKVLIIGGGDGGVLREVVKHPEVKRVILCEIDQKVIDVCRQYFPGMTAALEHPKATVVIEDGSSYVKQHLNEFDVIIRDSSDTLGTDAPLQEEDFYMAAKASLKEDGILCCQGDNYYLMEVAPVQNILRRIFPVVRFNLFFMTTYLAGQTGLHLASKNPKTKFESPLREIDEEKSRHLKYYSTEIHESSFVLPPYARNILYGKEPNGNIP